MKLRYRHQVALRNLCVRMRKDFSAIFWLLLFNTYVFDFAAYAKENPQWLLSILCIAGCFYVNEKVLRKSARKALFREHGDAYTAAFDREWEKHWGGPCWW